ncbi:MAG TPA: sensor histidine kinase [Streptosporangiaceae bacterium]
MSSVRLPSWICRNQLAQDALVAGAAVLVDTVTTLVGSSWWPAHPGSLAWSMLVLQALADSSLVLRRRAPMLVIAIFTAFTLAISLLIDPAGALTPAVAGNIWAPYGTVVAAYGPFYYAKNRRVAYGAVGILTLAVARVWDPSATIITIAVLRTAFGPLVALYFTAREQAMRALRDRAERAEREQHLLAEQARADERARLAGEMHDVVTHRVSLMVLQAGALGITATDDPTRRAAEELRAAGVQALDELRDLVGILRTAPEDDRVPSFGLAELVAESTAVGTPAELVEAGDPGLASPVVGRTAYRIVREALTNVRKHAPGAQVTVRVDYSDTQVQLSVRNTAAVAATGTDLTATGSGLGLASLRQRVELVQGTLRAGGTPDGGFRLDATMPSYVPTAVLAAGGRPPRTPANPAVEPA